MEFIPFFVDLIAGRFKIPIIPENGTLKNALDDSSKFFLTISEGKVVLLNNHIEQQSTRLKLDATIIVVGVFHKWTNQNLKGF